MILNEDIVREAARQLAGDKHHYFQSLTDHKAGSGVGDAAGEVAIFAAPVACRLIIAPRRLLPLTGLSFGRVRFNFNALLLLFLSPFLRFSR